MKYEVNKDKRIKARSKRRMTVFTRAHELCHVAGGDIFVRYKDEYGMIWTYSSTDELWDEYKTKGLHLNDTLKEARCAVDHSLYSYEPHNDDINQVESSSSNDSLPSPPTTVTCNQHIQSTPESNRPKVNKTLSFPPIMSSIGEEMDVSQIASIRSESSMIENGLQNLGNVDITGIVNFVTTEETSSMDIEGDY